MCSEESMDKPSGKCRFRTQSWYLVLITFLLWFTLFYLYSTSVTFGKVGDSFLGSNQIDFVESVTDEVIDETGDSEDVINGNSETEKEQKPINFSIHDQAGLNKPLKAEQKETQSSVTISGKDEDMDNKTVDVGENGSISQLQRGENKEKEKPSRRKNKKTIVDLSSAKEEWKQNASLESPITQKDVALSDSSSSCFGRYIYMHDLPRKFNQDLLDNCKSLSLWTDMCEYISNLGLGSPLPRNQKLYSTTGWFATNQFLLEVIFHYRMKQYKCLTKDPSLASAIYVPYYAGLDVGRYLWDPDGFMRDYDAVNLVKWLVNRPEWMKMWGRDHFLVAGRINWDFRRDPKNESDWGNELLNFPESKNMTMLVIESSPWNSNDFAIPYPTYFHPTKDGDVFQWQDRMKRLKRRYLFSFAGAPRPNIKDSIRNEIINQCLASRRKCKFLECDKTQKCYQPVNLMKLFQSSVFCLQPPGDSYTRRSIFDAILAGCIPVFFHPGSAYVQYIWHFHKDYTKYSVMIPANDVKSGKANIERILRKFPREKIFAMREQVIRLIPKVIYADPTSRLGAIQDAFDLTIKGVLDRVETVRNQMRDGKEVNLEFDEEESWKYFTFGKLGVHEWDPFFSSKLGKPCK